MPALIGQRRAETLLARAVASGRVGHAYLFLGPRGAGKATAARSFAAAINCERQPAASAEEGAWRLAPCGRCESCRRIAAGTHPEVLAVRPATAKGQNIGIDQAREVRRNAALRPRLGSRRVYVFEEAEALNEEAANALLKTLEEPSDFATLVLCAPSPSRVLPTVRSRCQLVRFGLAPADELTAALVARGVEAHRAAVLARASGGLPGSAIAWAEEPGVLERRGQILDVFLESLAAASEAGRRPSAAVRALRLAERLRELAAKDEDASGRPAKVLHSANIETALTVFRDLLLLASGAGPALVQNQDRVSQLEKSALDASPERLVAGIEALQEAQQLLDRNVSPQLVFERMFWAIIAGPAAYGTGRTG